MTGSDPIIAARSVRKVFQPSIPVCPDQLAKMMGIAVEYVPLSRELCGVLLPEKHGNETHYMIVVNTRHPRERQKFSVAHELGHYWLHRGLEPAFMHQKNKRGRIEREANQFAAELLMPAEEVKLAALFTDFKGLVQMFGVSKIAMQRRIEELGISLKKGLTSSAD